MAPLRCLTSAAFPYFDGSRILFEVTDGANRVPCAISRLALEVLLGKRCFKTRDLLAGFAKAQSRIELCAIQKLHARPESVFGRLSLWADDVDDPPTDYAPNMARGLAIQFASA